MILVDPRIGPQKSSRRRTSHDIIEPLRARVNCRVQGKLLNSGDACFSGNGPEGKLLVGVEIKELRDMLGSMRSERLAGDQLVKMSDDYQMTFVIIQGQWKPSPSDLLLTLVRKGQKFSWEPIDLAAKSSPVRKCFHYGELFKHIVSMTVQKNVIVLWSRTVEETVTQIAHLYAWWSKPWDSHKSMEPLKLQTEVVFKRHSLLRKMAAELPGIGWTRSAAVEKAFLSVHQMVNASVEFWSEIDGIGPKTAKTVWTELRRHV